MNHYPHHLGDYAKDTLSFSALEHGVYRLILDAYYATEEAPLADEVHAIAKANTAAERKAVDKVLRKFELRDGRYFHKRVEAEIAAYRARAEVARVNGKLGGRRKPRENPAGYQGGNQPDTQGGYQSGNLASSHKPVKQSQVQAAPQVSSTVAESPPLAALAAVCVANRVSTEGTKALLHMRQMVSDGVTGEQLADAIAIARERKPDPEVIPVAYLPGILADLRAGRVSPQRSTQDVIAQAIANIAAKEAKNAAH